MSLQERNFARTCSNQNKAMSRRINIEFWSEGADLHPVGASRAILSSLKSCPFDSLVQSSQLNSIRGRRERFRSESGNVKEKTQYDQRDDGEAW